MSDKQDRTTFSKVGEQQFSSVSSGDYHILVIEENGYRWSCGHNNYGQLGLNDKQHKSTL